MFSIAFIGYRRARCFLHMGLLSRSICDHNGNKNEDNVGERRFENGCEWSFSKKINSEFPEKFGTEMKLNQASQDKSIPDESFTVFLSPESNSAEEDEPLGCHNLGGDEAPQCRRFYDDVNYEADKILEVIYQDGPGFDAKSALEELHLRITNRLVREVLIRISKSINDTNKSRSAKLGYKFFVWSGQQENYRHTSSMYNLIMKIFADCDEFKAMWRLVDEMTENGFPTTARTFNILICTCGKGGVARKLVERFIKSKNFNYRPYKHSFNAILHSLHTINQYKLIEWVYRTMLTDGYSPDVLTYNILIFAKYKLGKLYEFYRLLAEMDRSGFAPDLHTYNILLHVLGKGDKPVAALNLLNHMEEVGCHPSILHYTTLIDGFSRAGNLEACVYFFEEMIKRGFEPDVVCYTVMITGFVVAGELEKAQELFEIMVNKGQLPNVFTYNSMIRGLCVAGKFEEACLMLKEMESKGCNPNFVVYSTLVGNLRNAGKFSKAHEIISQMMEKGQYIHLISNLKGYKRC